MSVMGDAIKNGAGSAMGCRCGAPLTGVLDSRPIENGSRIRRRRMCGACGHRFTTYEISQEEWDRLKAQDARLQKIVSAVLEAEAPDHGAAS